MFQHNLMKKACALFHDKLHFNELIPISSASDLSLDIIVPAFHSEASIPMPYPECFISNGPLKWPVFCTLVWNEPSIWCHDCSHGCALRRQIYPIWSLFLKYIDRIPALEKLWPWELNGCCFSCMKCFYNTFMELFCPFGAWQYKSTSTFIVSKIEALISQKKGSPMSLSFY